VTREDRARDRQKRYREYRWWAMSGAACLLYVLATEDDKTAWHWVMLVMWSLVAVSLLANAYLDFSDRRIDEQSAAYRRRLEAGLKEHQRRRAGVVEEDRNGE